MFREPLLVRGQVLLFHLFRQLVLHLLTANIHDIVWSTVGQGAGTSVPLVPAAGTSSAHCKYTWYSHEHCFRSGQEWVSIGSDDNPDLDAGRQKTKMTCETRKIIVWKGILPWELETSPELQILCRKILQFLIKNMNFIFIKSISQFFFINNLDSETDSPKSLS